MSPVAIGALLALTAAVALNAGYLLQHAGSSTAPAIDARRPVATLAALLRRPVWLVGSIVGIGGWLLHIAALREAPLSLVQAFVAGGLALAVPMVALGLRRPLVRGEVQAIALMMLALLLLSVGLHDVGRHARFAPAGLGAWVCGLAVAAAVICARPPGPLRPLALGLAGGLLYGAADLSVKALTGLHGPGQVLTSPWLAAAAVTTAAAFFAFQRGLQFDRPLAVIALMTAATNVSSIAGAFAVFGDRLGRTPSLEAAHALGFVLILIAGWRLAPAPERLIEAAPADG